MRSSRGLVSAAAWSVCLLLASMIPVAAADCPDGTENVALVTLQVNTADNTFGVDPPSVTIYKGPGPDQPGSVCWVAQGLAEGYSLRIAGKGQQARIFSGTTTLTPSTTAIDSGSPAAEGTWRYNVWLDQDGAAVASVDPEVIIKKGDTLTGD